MGWSYLMNDIKKLGTAILSTDIKIDYNPK
jgi:hypothetical protein